MLVYFILIGSLREYHSSSESAHQRLAELLSKGFTASIEKEFYTKEKGKYYAIK